jgi:hypothetical protein
MIIIKDLFGEPKSTGFLRQIQLKTENPANRTDIFFPLDFFVFSCNISCQTLIFSENKSTGL